MRGRPSTGLGRDLRDVVYGASDGIVTTFAIVAGVSGAGLAPWTAIALGFANPLADGLSMGAGAYLSLRSELEHTGASVEGEKSMRHGLASLPSFVAWGVLPLASFLLVPAGSRLLAVGVLAGLVAFGVGFAARGCA